MQVEDPGASRVARGRGPADAQEVPAEPRAAHRLHRSNPRKGGLRPGDLSAHRSQLKGGVFTQEIAAVDRGARDSAAEARPVLWCEHLRKIYRMGEVDVRALDDVDFSLRSAELLVLLGASGSGKSTLLNILGGLDVPTSGRVYFQGEELTDADEDALTRYRRRHVGFVFQFYNLIPSLTARENVALVTDIADDPLDAAEALDLVGLGDRLDHFPAQLSGGEQQRVAIARAVAKRPSVLLCDEPTGALDSRTGIRVLEVIDQVNRELGTATAVITHNAPVAEMADRVVTLADGRVLSERHVGRRARPADLRW
jgi:putative ABC transport system ATP-binding protein